MTKRKAEEGSENWGDTTYLEPDEVEAAVASLPSEGTMIHLYRQNPISGPPRYVAKFSPHDFDPHSIKEVYGGGKFKFKVITEGVIEKTGYFEMEGEPIVEPVRHGRKAYIAGKGWVDLSEILPENSSVNSPASHGGSVDAGQLVLLCSKIDRMLEVLASPKKDDMLNQLLMGVLNRAMTGTQDAEDKILAKMQTYKGLFSASGGSVDAQTIFSALKQGMEVGSGSEGSPWLTALEKLGPIIEKVIESAQAAPRREKPPLTPPQNRPGEKDSQIVTLLRPYLPGLIVSASNNVDPAIVAEMIIGSIPESGKAETLSWLRGDAWFTDLCKIDQRISAQTSWWSELRGFLIELLTGVRKEGEDGSGQESSH